MTAKKKNEVATPQKDITALVLSKVEAFKAANELKIPKDYSPENALKSAYLILSETKNSAGKLALEACTKESIANALLKMVVWGLSPMKKQMSFIMYGNQLNAQAEYAGNIALAKRWGGLKDIKASAVFKGDDFAFDVDPLTGRKRILKHTQSLETLNTQDIVGAYAVGTMEDGSTFAEVMGIAQIKAAWNQGAAKGNSPAHKNFPDQMAIKTVINRACKLIIRGSDDSILYSADESEIKNQVEEDVAYEIEEEANKVQADIEVEEIPEPAPAEEPAPLADRDGQITMDEPNF